MGTPPVGVIVEPQNRETVDVHVPRERIHRWRCDDMVLHIVAQRRKPAHQRSVHVEPVPAERSQRHILSPPHQTDGGYHSSPRTSRTVTRFTAFRIRTWSNTDCTSAR